MPLAKMGGVCFFCDRVLWATLGELAQPLYPGHFEQMKGFQMYPKEIILCGCLSSDLVSPSCLEIRIELGCWLLLTVQVTTGNSSLKPPECTRWTRAASTDQPMHHGESG